MSKLKLAAQIGVIIKHADMVDVVGVIREICVTDVDFSGNMNDN
jgi:hypothetical protein